MLESSEAVILKTVKYGETSIILTVYTERLGYRSFIQNGVRKSKSRLSYSNFQIGNLIQIEWNDDPSKSILRIKDFQLSHPFRTIPFDLHKGSMVLFICEVLQKSIKEPDFHGVVFRFLKDTILYIYSTNDKISNISLYFLLELSSYLGFGPVNVLENFKEGFFDLKEGTFSKYEPTHPAFLNLEDSILLKSLLNQDISSITKIQIPRHERLNLLERLLQYYQLHIENMQDVVSHRIWLDNN